MLLLEYQKAWKPLLAGHKLVFLLLKSSLSSSGKNLWLISCCAYWSGLWILFIWKKDLWEAFGQTVFEDLVLCGAHQQSVRAASCANTLWLLAWHTARAQLCSFCPHQVIELRRPLDSRLEHVDFESLFTSLSVRHLSRVFASLLLERRVIFIADKLRYLLHFPKKMLLRKGGSGRLQWQISLLCSFSSLPFSNRAVFPRNGELSPWIIISFCSLQEVLLLIPKGNKIPLPPFSAEEAKPLLLLHDAALWSLIHDPCWAVLGFPGIKPCPIRVFFPDSQNLNFSACIFILVSKDFFLMGMKVKDAAWGNETEDFPLLFWICSILKLICLLS